MEIPFSIQIDETRKIIALDVLTSNLLTPEARIAEIRYQIELGDGTKLVPKVISYTGERWEYFATNFNTWKWLVEEVKKDGVPLDTTSILEEDFTNNEEQ